MTIGAQSEAPQKVVFFNASTQAMSTVLGGNLDVLLSSPGNPMPYVQSGKMRALAVSSTAPLPGAYAWTPTWKGLGVNSVSRFWRGLIGPSGLTPAQVAFCENEFVPSPPPTNGRNIRPTIC